MLKNLALSLIRGYQTYLSPHKGFCCAYRAHTGGASCSNFGYHAIEKHGLSLGLVLLRRRLAKCSWQAHQHSQPRPKRSPNARMRYQGGFVDGCDCSGCDTPSCDIPSCDLPSCDCDMPSFGKLLPSSDKACDVMDCGFDALSTFTQPAQNCTIARDCGPSCGGPGHLRESQRLDAIRKRREQRSDDDPMDEYPGAQDTARDEEDD